MAENQNSVDVKMNTIVIISQTDATNTVKNLSTLEMGLGQGTNHLTAPEMYGIDGSVIPGITIGKGGTIQTTTSEIPDVKLEASFMAAATETFSEGSR